MINVNQITAQLARMPDQALQQYAQMHKSDPYTLSLALAESNRRKQVRQGAQMNAPEQPKVVDQELQGMAAPMPESVGIGQLPTGDMNFAGGGIVAFADGGVPGYKDEGLVRYPGLIQYGANYPDQPGTAGPLFGGKTGYEGMGPGELVQAIYEDLKKKIGPGLSPPERARAEREAQRQANMLAATQRSSYDPAQYGVTTPAPLYPGARDYSKTESTVADPGAVQQVVGQQAAAAPKADTGAAGARGPGQRVPPAGAPGPAAPKPSIYDLATTPAQMKAAMSEMGVTSGVPAELTAGITGLKRAQQAVADENLKQIQAEQAARGPAFAKTEERLKQREGRVGKMEAEQGPMALLQAGLAIMGGTSRNALTNIGLGAQVGVKSYAEGLDKIERARDKLDESFARIEEVRRNEGRMDAKELREAKNAALQPAIDAKKLGLSALEKSWGFDRQDANKSLELLFKNRTAIIEQQGADRRTQMQVQAQRDIASMLPAELRGALVLGTGSTEAERLRSGIPALMELRDRMTDTKIAELYTKHVADAKAKLQEPLTPDAFAQTIRSAVGAYRPTVADVQNTRAR